jgi:hypothetical protein
MDSIGHQKKTGLALKEEMQRGIRVQDRLRRTLRSGPRSLLAISAADDPVLQGLRESARRMTGIAAFSGVINLLMLSGSLYMLQVYDRVIPSRNLATLSGLSTRCGHVCCVALRRFSMSAFRRRSTMRL